MGKGEVMERNKTNLNMDKVEDMRVRAQTISGQDGGLALKLWNAAYHGSGLRYEEVDIEARKQFLKALAVSLSRAGCETANDRRILDFTFTTSCCLSGRRTGFGRLAGNE